MTPWAILLCKAMDSIIPFLTPFFLALSLGIAFCAGFVKGVVGFAMPLVMISGLTTFIAPELALAGLIVPTLVSNMFQSLRQGFGAAWGSIKAFWVFLLSGGVTLVVSAQFVRGIPEQAMQLVIGVPVVLFVVMQLSGYQFRLRKQTRSIEAGFGGFAGVLGGMSGVWGPPTLVYLTALNTPKYDQMRIQGVIYGGGAAVLFASHLGSGVLRQETLPFSMLMVVPALLGMWIGSKVMDRIDQVAFRRATLIVLLVAGINLIRRGLF